MHRFREAHDTPFSALEVAPAGVGVGWTVQVLPSRRSAKAPADPVAPTAVQSLLDAHDTADRLPNGTDWAGTS